MTFRPGTRVVCVGAFQADASMCFGCEAMPEVGEVYTVRGGMYYPLGKWGILLEEIVNPVMDYADGTFEKHFWDRHFRPVMTASQRVRLLEATR